MRSEILRVFLVEEQKPTTSAKPSKRWGVVCLWLEES